MPVQVQIDATRLERLLRLPGSPGARLLRRRTDRVADRARQLAAPHGQMARTIEARVEGAGRGLRGVVTVNHPAAQWVLNGTPKHIIRPRRRKALRFEVDGRPTFAKIVHHPGYRGDNFLAEALRQAL